MLTIWNSPGKTGELTDCYQAELMVDEAFAEREKREGETLKENDIVLFKYFSYSLSSSGLPTNPLIYCKDTNLTWDCIIIIIFFI